MSKPEKEVISGRVPADTYDEFEEYREERNISKSDAVRRLVDIGLDTVQEEQKQERQNARAVTPAEEWCQEKARSWTGIGILSAMGFAFLFIVFMGGYFGVTIVPDWPLALAMSAFLMSFVMFTGGALVARTALRTGLARRLSESGEAAQEVNA